MLNENVDLVLFKTKLEKEAAQFKFPYQLCNNQAGKDFIKGLTEGQLSTFVFKMACIFSDDLDWDDRKAEIDQMNQFINEVYEGNKNGKN